MRDDEVRTEAFRREIRRVAPGKVVLDIGTGALALLAIFAAEAGAVRVFAIEGNPDSYAKALQAVRDRGFADRIHVVLGLSTNVTLPERVDVMVHEILGEIASIEGAAYAIRDAQRRHLTAFPPPPHTRISVPSSASSSICPTEMPDAEYWASREYPVIVAPGTVTMKLTHFPKRLLLSDTWQEMETLDFEAPSGLPATQERDRSFEMTRNGVFAGFVIRMQASMTPAAAEEIRTWCWDDEAERVSCQGHWAQQYIVFEPVQVSAGDVLHLRVHIDSSTFQPTYRFVAGLQRSTADKVARVPLGEVVLDSPNFG